MTNSKLFPIIILGLTFLASCSVNHGTASLKDAMKKSSNNHSGNRKVRGFIHKNSDSWDDDNYENDKHLRLKNKQTREKNKVAKLDSTYKKLVAFRIGTGFLSCKEFYGLNHFSLLKGIYSSKKHEALLFHFGLTQSPVQQTSLELSIGAEQRKYLTPSYVFLGNYLHIGGNLDFMFWKYQNTVYVDEYDDYGNLSTKRVNNDGLFGIDFFSGIGININQRNRKYFGLEITPGIQLWFPFTSQGFKNDYFSPYFYLKIGFILNSSLTIKNN
jgi:hypothetical protein